MPIEEIVWPVDRLGDAMAALCRHARLTEQQSTQAFARGNAGDIKEEVEHHAKVLGCDAETLHTDLRNLSVELKRAYPAVLELPGNQLILLLAVGNKTATVLTPQLKAPERCHSATRR